MELAVKKGLLAKLRIDLRICLLLFACSCSGPTPVAKETRRPNILFILADDHTTQAIGAYGGFLMNYAWTSNIDQLAAEGMLFKNVFCTNSICSPSRATILTGKYSHINGVRILGQQFDGSQFTFPASLQGSGYQTALLENGAWDQDPLDLLITRCCRSRETTGQGLLGQLI